MKLTLETSTNEFPCSSCGAVLRYEPGHDMLTCSYCGHENPIEDDTGAKVEENDLWATLHKLENQHETQIMLAVKCDTCAAEFTFKTDNTSEDCPFCGTSIVVEPHQIRQLTPDGVLPFAITREAAQAAANKWLNRLFFAPAKFKAFGRDEDGLTGMYVPFWTFDADSDARYTGQRGDNYTVTVGSGKNRRTETRTRWTRVSGRIRHFFDDVLIWAGRSVPSHIINRFKRWRLGDMKPYQSQYLVGLEAQAYDLPLKGGHEQAQEEMHRRMAQMVRQDIGGDKQRINTLQIKYADETFKLVLLPIWISALKYRGKSYNFVINGRTGEVRGDRPLSWFKVFLVAFGVLLLALLFALIAANQGAFD